MTTPVALQLYTVRDALAQDFAATVARVAEAGYAGVEPFAFPGTTPQAASQLFQSLGLAVPSAHLPMPLGERQSEALDAAAALGCRTLVSGFGPERFGTLDDVRRCADQFNEASAVAAAQGLRFAIHNHWWEFQTVEGRLAYQVLMERLSPEVVWEIDIYWVQTAGLDPAAVVGELGPRAPLLHVKDGPATPAEPMVAVGQGRLDIPGIARAGAPHTEWLIVELDRCATDMMEAVAQSYQFLVGEGLAHGTKG